MKSEMPFTPGISLPSGPGILASTRCTMLSDRSCSPPEINILAGGHQSGIAKCRQSGFHFRDDRDAGTGRAEHHVRLVLVALLVMWRKQIGGNPFANVDRRIEGSACMVGITLASGQRFCL